MTTARRLAPGTPWDRALDAAVHLGAVVARNDDDCRRQVNEAAVSVHGECHHPLDLARTPGGSSSGEAALIGFGASSLGLGSDSGGSIRLPAAWCGVFG